MDQGGLHDHNTKKDNELPIRFMRDERNLYIRKPITIPMDQGGLHDHNTKKDSELPTRFMGDERNL